MRRKAEKPIEEEKPVVILEPDDKERVTEVAKILRELAYPDRCLAAGYILGLAHASANRTERAEQAQ